MNPSQQQTHRTVTKQLESRVGDVEAVTVRLMHNGDALYLGSEQLVKRINALEDRLLSQDEEMAALKRQQGVTWSSLVMFCGRSLWKRLLWLATGH